MKFPPGPRAKVLLKLIFSMKTCLIFQINICARCELCQTVTMCSLLYYLHVAKLFPLAPFLFSFNQLSHLLFKFTSFFSAPPIPQKRRTQFRPFKHCISLRILCGDHEILQTFWVIYIQKNMINERMFWHFDFKNEDMPVRVS